MSFVKKTIVNLSCTKQAIVLLKASEKREIRLLELAELREAREVRRELAEQRMDKSKNN